MQDNKTILHLGAERNAVKVCPVLPLSSQPILLKAEHLKNDLATKAFSLSSGRGVFISRRQSESKCFG